MRHVILEEDAERTSSMVAVAVGGGSMFALAGTSKAQIEPRSVIKSPARAAQPRSHCLTVP
jgi:DUF917 family protein